MPNRFVFGTLPDGREITACRLCSDRVEATVLTLGATLQSLTVGGVDTVAGFDTVEGYLCDDSYQGAVVGRICNRLAGGTYEAEGQTVRLSQNEGANQLHGGWAGWNRKVWQIAAQTENTLTLSCHSPDGEEGFPGNVEARVTYTLRGDTLLLCYEARTDRATPVSMTCHAYFHLLGYGQGDVLQHRLWLDAAERTEVGPDLLPTGRRLPVAGTVYDFTGEKEIGADWPADFGGFDDNFVLLGTERENVLGHDLTHAARLRCGERQMDVYTDRPCLQLYIGNALTGEPPMKGGLPKRPHATVCLETQTEPDLATRRGETILRPGEVYRAYTAFRFH